MPTKPQLECAPPGMIWQTCRACGRTILVRARKDGTAPLQRFLDRPYCPNPEPEHREQFDELSGSNLWTKKEWTEEELTVFRETHLLTVEDQEQFLRWFCFRLRGVRSADAKAANEKAQREEPRTPSENTERYGATETVEVDIETKKGEMKTVSRAVKILEHTDEAGNTELESLISDGEIKDDSDKRKGKQRKIDVAPRTPPAKSLSSPGKRSQPQPVIYSSNPAAPYDYIPGTDLPVRPLSGTGLPQPVLQRSGNRPKYVPPQRESVHEMAARLRERMVEGRSIRVRKKGCPPVESKPLVEPKSKNVFVPLAELLGAHIRITSENILAWFGWYDTGYDTIMIHVSSPAVRTGNRVLDKARLDRLHSQLTLVRQRVKDSEARLVELDGEHDGFSAKARPDLDAKTRNKYRAQIRRQREAVDKDIIQRKSSIAQLMNEIKKANNPVNYIDEVISEKREQVRHPGPSFLEWSNTREDGRRDMPDLRKYEEMLRGSDKKGWGRLENHIIREAIRYGVLCPLPEAWLEDTKLPFGCVDAAKLIAASKHRISLDGITVIRYSLLDRGNRGSHVESEQDDPENALILKTGGAQIGGQVLGGRQTRTGLKLESFNLDRKGSGVSAPSGGTGDDDGWSGDVDSGE